MPEVWGRMASRGRLAIGLAGFVPVSKPITNRLQVPNLPHGAAVVQVGFWRARSATPVQRAEAPPHTTQTYETISL